MGECHAPVGLSVCTRPDEGGLSGGAGGTCGGRTVCSTAPSQEPLHGTRSKAHHFKEEGAGGAMQTGGVEHALQHRSEGAARALFEREGGEGAGWRGVWDSNVRGPKMAQPDFPDGNFRSFQRCSLWSGGGGGGAVGTRPRYLIVCLWRRLLASRHCSF